MDTKILASCKNASFGYDKKAVLSGVNLEIEAGSFVGILGHNGSGKTTFLRTFLGLIPAVRGKFAFGTADGRPPRFGYVPQKERLDPIYPLSVYNVAKMGTCRKFGIFERLRGINRRPLVERCLEDCGVLHLAHRPYSDLSGGQKQRVLIARALAAEPDLLALDEPLAGIDITTQKSILELLKSLKKRRHLTIMLVSHRVQAEKDLFSHILWCDEGAAVMGKSDDMLSFGRAGEVFREEL
jgi:ABC-type Mn2+/Zn2+ transport system ATPase subunit